MEVAFEVYGAVKSVKKQTFLSNQNIFNGTRLVDVALSGVLPRFLMVEGYLCRLWYRGQPLVSIFVPFRATDRQTALTRTSAESVGKPGTLLGIVPLTGQQETLRIFRPWPYLRSLRRPVSLVVLLNSAS